jgi:hypothetical protein
MNLRTLAVLTLAACAVAAGLTAQTPADPQTPAAETMTARTATGRVVSSTPTEIVIEDQSGARTTYAVDSSSTVPSGLSAGSSVSIEYHEIEAGRFHAGRVTTTGAPSAGAAAVTQPAPTQAVPRTSTEPVETPTTRDTSTDTTMATDTTSSRTARKSGRTRMPSTASPLPLVGLLGFASLLGGAALRALRRS